MGIFISYTLFSENRLNGCGNSISATIFLEKEKNKGVLAMAKQKELSVKELVSIDFSLIDGSEYDVEIYEPSQEVYRREKDAEGKYQDVELLGYKVSFQLRGTKELESNRAIFDVRFPKPQPGEVGDLVKITYNEKECSVWSSSKEGTSFAETKLKLIGECLQIK